MKETGISLQVISREDILTSLMLPENAALCRTLPGLEASIESDGVDVLERVRAALSEEIIQWKTRQRVRDRPIIALQAEKLDAAGKGTTDILNLDEILAALRQSRRVALEAPGGGGKTTTLVELASRTRSDTELLFLVDLPVWILSGSDLLDYIARAPPTPPPNTRAGYVPPRAPHTHFSFLLNGWNEVTELHSPSAIAALDSLERDFPASGILVATRTHYVSPPLAGAIRLKLHSVTRQQRNEYLRSVLGARAEELRLQIDASRVLDGLTRTPLILSEVVTIFQSGATVPITRVGILAAVVDLIENAPAHRAHLQNSPIGSHAKHYLSALATSMTDRGQVLVPAAEARAAMRGASNELLVAEQISAPADPDALLHVLTSHHVLEQVDYPSLGYRFQHQRFQEYYASQYLLGQLAEGHQRKRPAVVGKVYRQTGLGRCSAHGGGSAGCHGRQRTRRESGASTGGQAAMPCTAG